VVQRRVPVPGWGGQLFVTATEFGESLSGTVGDDEPLLRELE
jgi:hypothetical protein